MFRQMYWRVGTDLNLNKVKNILVEKNVIFTYIPIHIKYY